VKPSRKGKNPTLGATVLRAVLILALIAAAPYFWGKVQERERAGVDCTDSSALSQE
jgi:hypothetical protein